MGELGTDPIAPNAFMEFWFITCGTNAQFIANFYGGEEWTGDEPEWELWGGWIGFTINEMGPMVVIGENSGGWMMDGTSVPGTFTVLSKNPFHAIGTVTLPVPYPFPAGLGGTVNCSPVTIEFTE